MNIKDYIPLSFGPHPEYKTRDRFILLQDAAYNKPGDFLWLYKNYNTELSDFCNNEGSIVTTFWNRVAPCPVEAGDRRMSDNQFNKLRFSFLNYEDLEETTEKLEEIMNIYYMEDDSKYYDAKKLFEDIKEKMKKIKSEIMEMQL